MSAKNTTKVPGGTAFSDTFRIFITFSLLYTLFRFHFHSHYLQQFFDIEAFLMYHKYYKYYKMFNVHFSSFGFGRDAMISI